MCLLKNSVLRIDNMTYSRTHHYSTLQSFGSITTTDNNSIVIITT